MTNPQSTSSNTLWISAGLKVSNNKSTKKAKEQLQILQQQTLKEKGCIFFDVLQNKEDSNLFTLWEQWVDEDALKQHFEQVHTKNYLAQSLTQVSYIEKLIKLS